jgi:hypothetical protein
MEIEISNFKLSIETIAAVGSFLSGVVMLITMIRVMARIKFKEEIIYGEEARIRYDKIKNKLENHGIKIKDYKYEGGRIIIPRLEFERCHYNSITMGKKLKGCKKRVRFVDKDEAGKRIVKTWYLK